VTDLILVALIAAAPAMLTVFLAVNRRSIDALFVRLSEVERKVDLLLELMYPAQKDSEK